MEIIGIIRDVIALIFCVLASVFAVGGTIGLIKAPDTYTRLQGAAVGSTTAPLSLFIAALAASGTGGVTGRIILIMIFFFISSPTTTHIIARYTWYSGIDPWTPRKKKLFGDRKKEAGKPDESPAEENK